MRWSRSISALFAWALLASAAVAATEPQLSPQEQAELAKFQRIAAGLHPQYGEVKIASADATLHLGREYYFLPANEARTVLVDAWHNPPEVAAKAMGIIFPAGTNFVNAGWAAVITYHPDGFVDDKDAKSTDYDEMLKQAHDAEGDLNARRKEGGFEPIHLVGWAQPPYYDQGHHTLVWARDLKFGTESEDTLNYDLRALGRRGVLSMNIIAPMSKLAEVRGAAAKLQNIGTFDTGARYQDYRAGSDKTAEYTVGGLVAAGLGVLAAKKLGLLALGLVFFKKFIAIILAAVAGAGAWLRRMFAGRKAAAATPAPAPMEPPSLPPAG